MFACSLILNKPEDKGKGKAKANLPLEPLVFAFQSLIEISLMVMLLYLPITKLV